MLRLFTTAIALLALLCSGGHILGPQSAFAQISAPTDVSDLVFWVDAQDVNGNGVQPANGAAVATWVDKSTGGNNLSTLSGTVTYEATGFDGVNPGLRFPLVARMAGANPFAGDFQNEITVFFVSANVTKTNNFALSLNGTNQSTNIADGRFSFHTPWGNNNIYFDSGACCGSTRLWGPTPTAITETTLYTGMNDQPGNQQLLRVDALPFRADATGHNASVKRGVHLGDFPGGISYNGRFAEVVVYDRGLTMSEVEDVECYLMQKWKPASAPASCTPAPPVITANKSVQPYINTGEDSYAIPGNDVIYTLTLTHESGADLDAGTVFLIDTLPSSVSFYNGDIDDAGPEINPVKFTDNSSGLTLNYASDIGFATGTTAPANMTACNYPPVPGYDSNVKFVCINPSGVFNSGTPNPSFSVSFRAVID